MTHPKLAVAGPILAALFLAQSCQSLEREHMPEPVPVSTLDAPEPPSPIQPRRDRRIETIAITGFLRDVDGAPFTGAIKLALHRKSENSHSVFGPFEGSASKGELVVSAGYRANLVALNVGPETEVEITVSSEGSWSPENMVWTKPGLGKLARTTYLPFDHLDEKPYELGLGDLQLTLPPAIGELRIEGPLDSYIMGLGNGDLSGRSMTGDDRGHRAWEIYQHELPTGVPVPLFSWAERDSFTVWQEDDQQVGLVPQAFPVGSMASVSITGSADVILLLSGKLPQGLVRACAFPSDTYVAFEPVDPEGEDWPGPNLDAADRRALMDAPFLGVVSRGTEDLTIDFDDITEGSYVFEVWSVDALVRGVPSAILTAEVTKHGENAFTVKP